MRTIRINGSLCLLWCILEVLILAQHDYSTRNMYRINTKEKVSIGSLSVIWKNVTKLRMQFEIVAGRPLLTIFALWRTENVGHIVILGRRAGRRGGR